VGVAGKSKSGGLRKTFSRVFNPPIGSANRAGFLDLFRTRAAYIGFALFLLFAFWAVVGLFLAHRFYPSVIDFPTLVQLYVGLGTGLLAVAAVATMYFQAIDRIADRAPNLDLTFNIMDRNGKREDAEEGEVIKPWEEDLRVRITSVGPGVARDAWYYALPQDRPGRLGMKSARGPPRFHTIPSGRFLRPDKSVELPGRRLGTQSTGEDGWSSEDQRVLVVGCFDLDGRIGDVQILGLERKGSTGLWEVLGPSDAEAANFRLSKGMSLTLWRRMGFWPRQSRPRDIAELEEEQ
jgi:hypothetical protein